jgi:ubiquinone/menaquinone biosynthesis C-methylase UbiE
MHGSLALNARDRHNFDMVSWWDQNIVPRLIGCACSQPQIMKHRALVVPKAHGDVLELGAGGGINAAFYDARKVRTLAGIDPSPALINQARNAWAKMSFTAQIHAGLAEALPFDDAHFDTVVTTFTLCSVDDPGKALSEARRVLRPGGTLLFLEHGAAPDARPARWQKRMEPLWRKIAGNCHLTRPVGSTIGRAGFTMNERHSHYLPKTPQFLGWIEWGEAIKT